MKNRPNPPATFLQIEGENYKLNNQTFVPRGMNLGNWLNIEYFMHGLPSVESDMHRQMNEIFGIEKSAAYWKAYRDTYITEADFQLIASRGFNCIRLPLNANLFFETENFGEIAFEYIDKVFLWAARFGLYVQLDLHALPGGQARDHNADPPYGIHTAFWDHEFFREQALEIMEDLAQRYQDEPFLWGYSPSCEPMTTRLDLLQEYYRNAISRIRKHDKHHIILLEPNHWARDISSLPDDLFSDAQVTYQIHIYFFFHFDYLSMSDYPEEKMQVNRSALETLIKKSTDPERIHRPVTLAEFGVIFSQSDFLPGVKDPEKMAHILAKGTRDMRKIMEERKGGWCLWSYKDFGEIGMMYPAPNTPWKKYLNQPFNLQLKKWMKEHFAPDFKEHPASLSSVQLLLKDQFTSIDFDTIAAATLATKRVVESLALRAILLDLNKLPLNELLALATSFRLDYCLEREVVAEIILKD